MLAVTFLSTVPSRRVLFRRLARSRKAASRVLSPHVGLQKTSAGRNDDAFCAALRLLIQMAIFLPSISILHRAALPQGEWLRLSVDMQCFTTQGLDAARVDTPFLLLTQGRLELDVADIMLVQGMREKAAIRC